jgi:hypothetical protein
MFTVEISFVNFTNTINMRDYDAAIVVAEQVFKHSNVAPDSVTVWDFGENNDQNQMVWSRTRRYESRSDTKTLAELFAESQA